MADTINPVAAQVVDNSAIPNSNGIQGSLPGETKAQTQARLYKVNVDGQEFEVDENELRQRQAKLFWRLRSLRSTSARLTRVRSSAENTQSEFHAGSLLPRAKN